MPKITKWSETDNKKLLKRITDGLIKKLSKSQLKLIKTDRSTFGLAVDMRNVIAEKKRNSKEESTSSPESRMTVWSWKDERWSADKKTLDGINKMINLNSPRRKYFHEVCRHFVDGFFSFIVRIYTRLAKIYRE